MILILILTLMLTPMHAQARDCPEPVEVTYEEAQLLMKVAFCEAGNQGIEGQRYVMSVILNRVNSPEFPNSIKEVVYQPHQFATKGIPGAEITEETHRALAEIECGCVYPDIIGFEKIGNTDLEKYFVETFRFRDHIFYKKGDIKGNATASND